MARISIKNQKKKVDAFLKKHSNAQLNPDRDIDHFIKITAQGGGSCPCDDDRPSCPCKQAPSEIKKKGKCLCGLYVRKK